MPVTVVQQQLRRHDVALAGGLLVVELAAGMQIFLSQAVLPFMAQDLGATEYHGVVIAAAWISFFFGMPLGVGLSSRFGVGRVLVAGALVLVGGSVVAAASAAFWVYLIGMIVRSVAGGCLATVSMSALVVGLRGRLRQLVLAGIPGMWVIATFAGPTYATSVTEAMGWRWAMVLYLPVVLAALLIVSSRLPPSQITLDAPLGHRQALTLGAALALLVLPDLGGWVQIVTLIAAGLVMLWGVRSILPIGRLGIRSPRRSAFAFLMVLCATYFGAGSVLTPIGHDVYFMSAGQLNLLLTAGGLGWALTSLGCGARPVRSAGAYVTRASAGTLLLIGGIACLALLESGRAATPWLMVLAWTVAGIGMGLAFVDTLNILFTTPNTPDGLDKISVASGAVISVGAASAFSGTASAAYLGQGFGVILSTEVRAHTLLLALAVIGLAMIAPLIAVRRQWFVEGWPAAAT
ncbi:MAG: MFS transporter [Propionicimonas sp.]